MKNGIIAQHVKEIKENIKKHGNSYGVKGRKTTDHTEKTETILFKGCTPTYKTPEILNAAENILKAQKIDYSIMDDETCCGNILFNLGDKKAGEEAVKRNIDKFKKRNVEKIITLCPGCYHAFCNYYQDEEFNPEVILLVDLIDESIPGTDFMIQDPCHAREKGSKVRDILSSSSNKSKSPCCGAGAGVLAHNPTMATVKAQKNFQDFDGKVVTYCPFCYLNLSRVNPVRVKDLYMLIDEHQPLKPKIIP